MTEELKSGKESKPAVAVLTASERRRGFKRPVRLDYKHDTKDCGKVTTLTQRIAEIYARQPDYHGSTFCASCGAYFPIKQFKWVSDGTQVGS